MDSEKLRKLATLKRHEVTIADEKILVREPTALEHVRFREIMKEQGEVKASAHLIRNCVINEDGTPALSEEDADFIAAGSARVALLLIGGILSEVEIPKVKND